MKKYKICDFVIELDFDERFIYERFDSFVCDDSETTDIYFHLKEGKCPYPEGLVFNQNGGFRVAEKDGTVYVHYEIPENEEWYAVRTAVFENEGRKVTYYLRNNIDEWMSDGFAAYLKKYIFLFMREAIMHAVRMNGGISIHSASIIYKEKAIVFSAPSKTGKSTHTNMWADHFDTPVLDGDITACRIIDGVPYVYGLPWAGSSGKFMNRRAELGAIVFLEQRGENVISVPMGLEAFSRLYSRSFSPRWLQFQIEKDIENTNSVMKSGIKLYVLGCKPELAAVELMKKKIDEDVFGCTPDETK